MRFSLLVTLAATTATLAAGLSACSGTASVSGSAAIAIKELSFSRWITYYDGPKTYGNLFVNDNEIFADPSAHASAMITSPEFNTSGWSTPALNSLVSAGLATSDNSKRLAIYGDIMKTIAAAVPYVPLFVVDYNVALRAGYSITNKFSIVYNFSQPWELYVTQKAA
jgi:ABC-type transport system substrate-binding protein